MKVAQSFTLANVVISKYKQYPRAGTGANKSKMEYKQLDSGK